MGGSTFLQLFLFLDVFIAGMIAAVAVRHGYAHFKPAKISTHQPPQTVKLPAATRDRLLDIAEANYQVILKKAAAELEQSLATTATSLEHTLKITANTLDDRLKKLGTEIIDSELARYKTELAELRAQAATTLTGGHAEIDTYKAELKTALEAQISAEKAQLEQQIDSKLADAVASFLMETLPHNVDLGAQSAYLTAMLEEHKADFKSRLSNEA